VLDDFGLPTVSITLFDDITALVRPSLSCLVEHPFGLTLGAVGDRQTQRTVLEAVLKAAYASHPAGTILDMGFVWDKDDLRDRQLRGEAF
jgi:hypothetical protein